MISKVAVLALQPLNLRSHSLKLSNRPHSSIQIIAQSYSVIFFHLKDFLTKVAKLAKLAVLVLQPFNLRLHDDRVTVQVEYLCLLPFEHPFQHHLVMESVVCLFQEIVSLSPEVVSLDTNVPARVVVTINFVVIVEFVVIIKSVLLITSAFQATFVLRNPLGRIRSSIVRRCRIVGRTPSRGRAVGWRGITTSHRISRRVLG